MKPSRLLADSKSFARTDPRPAAILPARQRDQPHGLAREHAHIAFHKRSGEYRLYNDRWYKQGHKGDGGCGLWIIRDGLSQEVHRNARGTRLQHGDEIHLGRAVVQFQLK